MIEITITTIGGYTFNICLKNLHVDNIKKRIYQHFKSLNNNDAYKYNVKYQTLLLNTKPLEDDILKNGDVITLILRSKTDKEQKQEEQVNRLINMLEEELKKEGLI